MTLHLHYVESLLWPADSPQRAQEILGPVWLTELFVSVAVPGGSLGPPRWPSGLLQLRTPVSACGQEHTGRCVLISFPPYVERDRVWASLWNEDHSSETSYVFLLWPSILRVQQGYDEALVSLFPRCPSWGLPPTLLPAPGRLHQPILPPFGAQGTTEGLAGTAKGAGCSQLGGLLELA